LRIIAELRDMISKIPLESFSVKKVFRDISDAWDDDFWNYMTPEKLEFLKMKVSPLLRFVPGLNVPESFFTSKMDRCGLFLLENKDIKVIRESINEDVSLLPLTLPQISLHKVLINDILTGNFWADISLKKLDETKLILALLMKYKREKPSLIFELGLEDVIDSRKWIIIRKESQKIYVEEYRKKVEEKILKLADDNAAIKKFKEGKSPTLKELEALEKILNRELLGEDISLDEENMLKAFGVKVGSLVDFLKHILKLETLPSYKDIIGKSFDAFIIENNYNADQIRFLRAVQSVFLERKKIEVADLYEHPFTNFGANAVEKLFTEIEISEIIELTKKLVA